MTNRQHIKKQRHHLGNKGLYSQSYCFSSNHVWMWELDHTEGWVPKNRCFWTVVLDNTLESPLDSKEIKLVNPKGNQPWIFIARTDAEVEAPTHGHLIRRADSGKDPDAGKDWGQEKGVTENEIVGCHYRLNGPEFEQTPGEAQRRLAMLYSSWSSKESNMI